MFFLFALALLRNTVWCVLLDCISSGYTSSPLISCNGVLCASQLNYDMCSTNTSHGKLLMWPWTDSAHCTLPLCITIQYISVYACMFCVYGCCLYLQVEKLQAVQFVEEIMGESSQLAAVHVQALQLLQTSEGSTLQVPKWGVITQIQLFQHPKVTEGPGLNPRNVVAI